MVTLCIGGGMALLAQVQQGSQRVSATYAMPQYGDVGVSGPPTLTAATVDGIFARLGSPMVGTGKAVEAASRQSNIDDAFALGVWWTETNDGAAGVGLADRNPGSVRGSVGYPSAYDGYTIYPSYTAAIDYWFNMLRNNYVNHGLSTVYAIARPYVGTTSYPLWAGKVINLMWSYRGIAPPPPPVVTATPRPKPTISPAQLAILKARQQKLATLLQTLSIGNATPVYTQGLTQETSPFPTTTQANNTATLPGFVQNAVIVFGLLLAIAVALLGANFPSPQPSRVPEPRTPARGILYGYPGGGEDLPLLPTPSLSTPLALPAMPITESQQRITEALPRRIKLLPASTETRTPVTVEANANNTGKRPHGLLSLYGQEN